MLTGNIHVSLHRKAQELGIGFVEKPITEYCVAQVLAYLDNQP